MMRWVFIAGLVFGALLGPQRVARAYGLAEEAVPPEVCAWVRRLRQTSHRYLASTPQAATQIARTLIPARYPDASSVCGPLAASLLADMDLLPERLIPEFWLINPRTDKGLLAQAFPEALYVRYDFSTPVGLFDFSRFPLVPGDVVYLYSGRRYRGFEHILVVTWVTPAGRVYGLSNVYDPKTQGYVIREILLYDLRDPRQGYFRWWNDPRKKRQVGGSTGTAGFTVWRQKALLPYVEALARGACAYPGLDPALGAWPGPKGAWMR